MAPHSERARLPHVAVECAWLGGGQIAPAEFEQTLSIPNPPSTNQPLTPAVFHILLALSSRERHGYGIMKQVEQDSQGKVKMESGTLYGSLKRMLDAGLVRESDTRIDPEMDDQRRIYYQITGAGTQALAVELERLRHIVTLAQEQNLFPTSFAYEV